MQITIVPQTQEQFDRLMALLEKDHAAFVADLERKANAEAERTAAILKTLDKAVEYIRTTTSYSH